MNHPLDAINKIVHENDKALRNIFGKYIKGNFLIEMKHFIMDNHPELYNYYDLSITNEKMVSGDDDYADYDICRMIVGCHSSNTIFLSDEKKRKLEKDTDYKNKLKNNVLDNIALRGYGSKFFRKVPIVQGEPFIFYNLPYDLFVVSIRMNELLITHTKKSPCYVIYSLIANKSLAALSLLEDNFSDNSYPICRSIIELHAKLLIFVDNPSVLEVHERFRWHEINQSCCGEQNYTKEFNEEYEKRFCQKETKKVDYLHYGWVDGIPNYHKIVKYRPYSFNGLITYLKKVALQDNKEFFDNIEVLYKMCHGYAHGNVANSKYPLLHYFEISIMLYMTVFHAYCLLCEELSIPLEIQGINLKEKTETDFEVLNYQYNQRSTENFERHYKKNY